MINPTAYDQLSLFQTPFEQHLDAANRWVVLAHKLPWATLEKVYNKNLHKSFGQPGITARMAIAALIIKQPAQPERQGDHNNHSGKYVYAIFRGFEFL